jgi:hypothetical protein
MEVRPKYNNKTPLNAKSPTKVRLDVVERVNLFGVFIQPLNYVGNHHIHGCVL